MEAKEIYERVKSGKATYEELLAWCSENKERMNLEDSYEKRLYDTLVRHSMKTRIGKLTKEEAAIYVHFFAKKMATDLGLDEVANIKVLEADEYKEYDEDDSQGICISRNDGTYDVAYNISKISEKLMSNNKHDILIGLQTIFHEMRHVTQNVAISLNSDKLYKKSIYIMTLETILRKVSPKFYKENYQHLIKENDAEKVGLQMALEAIKERNPKLYALYNQEKMEELMQKYDQNFYEGEFEVYGYKGDSIKSLDTWAESYIERHPELVSRHPILRLAYNEAGKKKDIVQMLQEREEIIQKRPKDQIDELYGTMLNRKFFDREEGISTEGELLALDSWVEQTGTEDEFIYDLIRFRLDRSEMTEDEKDNFISQEKAKASLARKLREEGQQEREPQKSEGIKDEIGDEVKGNAQGNEAIWLNRMQWCYDKSTQIENYTGKQAEAIKAISEQLRARDQKEIDSYMGK